MSSILSLFSVVTPCFADPMLDSQLSARADKLTPAQHRDLIAKATQLDPNSSRLQKLVNASRERTSPTLTQEEQDAERNPPAPKIVEHRKGKGGIAFLRKDQRPKIEVDRAQFEKIQAEFMARDAEKLKAQLTVPKLARCANDRTTKQNLGKPPAGQDSKATFDVLYVDASVVPLDPWEIVGANPVVMPYSAEIPNSIALAGIGAGVKCLPYRMRVTTSATYIHEGRDALKNYDNYPDGIGKFDPRAERMLGVAE